MNLFLSKAVLSQCQKHEAGLELEFKRLNKTTLQLHMALDHAKCEGMHISTLLMLQ